MFRIIKIIFILLFVTIAGIGGWGWYTLSPQWETLKEKDPERFEAMIVSAKGMRLTGMVQLFREIKQLTQEEVYRLSYDRWKTKMQKDQEYSLAYWNEQVLLREEALSAKKEEWDQKITNIDDSHEEGDHSKEYWQNASPWEKALLLREKCIKYFSLEKQASRRGLQARQFSSVAILTSSPIEEGNSIPELCARLVPITHNPKSPELALDSLKNHMNYFYFSRLLKEIGIPSHEVFVFDSKLNRMTQAFSTH